MNRKLLATGLLTLAGCHGIAYLNPSGPGESRLVGGPCPFPYRVLDIPVPQNDAHIYLNAFGVDQYARDETTIFLVVSDSRVFSSQLTGTAAPRQKFAHAVSFPEGTKIQVTADGAQPVTGQFTTLSDGQGGTTAVILKFSYPVGAFSLLGVEFPAVTIDGHRMEIGRVDFKPAQETLYGINC